MRLYANPTSPFVRIARMAMAEKGIGGEATVEMVDAWADRPDFLEANPAGRVPTLVLDDGTRLTEASLILRWLDTVRPEPALCPAGADGAAVLERTGVAIGVIEASVSVIIGRKSAPGFDGDLVGSKRFRTMRDGLARLEATQPSRDGIATLDLADIAAITAFDYLLFRFPDIDWASNAPRLAAFRAAQADRASVRDTAPRG